MKTQFLFNTVDQLQNSLFKEILKNRCTMVRIFEYDKSYEDYSISYTLKNEPVFNFVVTEDENHLILRKKAKNSKCHIQFPKKTICAMEYFNKSKPYLALYILSKISYTDGRTRY